MALRAVLFDLDETLWRSQGTPEWEAITALQAERPVDDFHSLGLPFDCGEFVRRFWKNYSKRFADPELVADTPIEDLRWIEGGSVIRSTLADYDVDCAASDGERLWEAISAVPLSAFNVSVFPDAVATTAALAARGYHLAVVTGRPLSARFLARELIDQGLPDVFAVIVTAGEAGYRKPHSSLFESALNRLDVSPEQAVMVGDSYEEDVAPASRLGMLAVLKLNERQPDARWTLANHQVPSLGALLELEILAG